jgi:hypothetical protein
MKVERQPADRTKKLELLLRGDTFDFEGEIYLKTDEFDDDECISCVLLRTGFIHYIEAYTFVTPIAYKAVLDTEPATKRIQEYFSECESISSDVGEDEAMMIGAIYRKIEAERDSQDAKWGPINDHPHEVGGWLTIMRVKLAEAEAAWQSNGGDVPALHKILQVVTVGIACMEQHGVGCKVEALPDSGPDNSLRTCPECLKVVSPRIEDGGWTWFCRDCFRPV